MRRGLPGDPDDPQARYLEAAVDGIVVGCLYLPNGNPQPGPKFDYKLAWFERLHRARGRAARVGRAGRARGRLQRRADADATSTRRRSYDNDALVQPESRAALRAGCSTRAGPTRSARCIPDETIYTFWDYMRKRWERDAGPAHRPPAAQRRAARSASSTRASTRRCAAAPARAITRRRGSPCADQLRVGLFGWLSKRFGTPSWSLSASPCAQWPRCSSQWPSRSCHCGFA